MAHCSDPIFTVDKNKVKIANGTFGQGIPGKSQTINVFDHTDTEGHYQEVYRISDPQDYVTEALIKQNSPNIHALERYLLKRGAVKEGPRL